MCGISGIISTSPIGEKERLLVSRMGEKLVHRGPDGAGQFETQHALLAMRRLEIVDRAGSAQPLVSGDGKLSVIFNGEIYNFRELRDSIDQSGYAWRTGGDGEVILALYQKFGLDFVHHLRGMFAIALWDGYRNRAVLVRDRMGEKPLYISRRPHQLIFASELKSIIRAHENRPELDAEAIHQYFHYQYVPEPRSAVKGITKLPAGHMLVVDVDPWKIVQKCYWRMGDAAPIEGDPTTIIREKLSEASKLVSIADVPVGVGLSAGLDSSIVAALAHNSNPSITAFTVGYPGHPESDERRTAAAFAKSKGINFREIELDQDMMVAAFPSMTYWRDDPIADIAGHGYYGLMQHARAQGIKVMLQGHGGDELFWGYSQLRDARARTNPRGKRWWNPIPAPQPRSPSRLFESSPDYRDAAHNVGDYYSKTFFDAVSMVDLHRQFLPEASAVDRDVALTEHICATYLRENGIAQGDRLAMASSIEMRLPFMDHHFIEAVIGLRKAQTDGGLAEKAWLKDAVSDIIPASIRVRKKQGFAPPVRQWHDALFKAYGHNLIDGILVQAGILSSKGAASLAEGAYPRGVSTPLSFKALVLEIWWRQMSDAQ